MPRAPTVLLVAGASRSGSTILDQLIGRQPGCTSVGELHHIWDRGFSENQLCGCGKQFLACDFWPRVTERAFADDKSLMRHCAEMFPRLDRIRAIPRIVNARQGSGFQQRLERYRTGLSRLYSAIAEVEKANVIVDSSKSPGHTAILRGMNQLDVRCIHLVRDSRAVAHSLARRRRKPDVHDREAYMNEAGPAKSAVGWVTTNAALLMLRWPESRAALLRYEDLASDVASSLDGVATNLDLPVLARERFSSELDLARPLHTVSGNPVRFRAPSVQLKVDDAWQHEMSAGARATVTALSWPFLLGFGYRLAAPRPRVYS